MDDFNNMIDEEDDVDDVMERTPFTEDELEEVTELISEIEDNLDKIKQIIGDKWHF